MRRRVGILKQCPIVTCVVHACRHSPGMAWQRRCLSFPTTHLTSARCLTAPHPIAGRNTGELTTPPEFPFRLGSLSYAEAGQAGEVSRISLVSAGSINADATRSSLALASSVSDMAAGKLWHQQQHVWWVGMPEAACSGYVGPARHIHACQSWLATSAMRCCSKHGLADCHCVRSSLGG